jgi:murein DD-endopeptidase MepM/ murein hydrolase activator NlpD
VSRRSVWWLALVPTLAAVTLGAGAPVRAQPAPAAQESPPTTAGLLDELLNALFPTTTLPPPPSAAPPEPPPPDTAPATSAGGGPQPAAAAPVTERTIPPEAQRIINSVNRTGSNNTLALLQALSPLTALGLTLEEAAIVGMGRFPVAGEAYYSDDWLDARFTPTFHHHMGNDIFAARGTPVRSPADGVLQYQSEAVGGLSAYVTEADGTYYYMTHLDGFAPDLRSGARVKIGQVVGFVGSSGNAEGGSPHVHFEIRPRGGAAVNPKPYLDRWLAEAIRNVPSLLTGYNASVPRPLSNAGILRRFDTGSFAGPATTSEGPLLWAASIRRAGGNILLAHYLGTSEGAAALLDRGAVSMAVERRRAEQLARALLSAVTPPVLEDVISGPG